MRLSLVTRLSSLVALAALSASTAEPVLFDDLTGTNRLYTAAGVDALASPSRVWYATCPTGAATSPKVVTTAAGNFALASGAVVIVKFTYACTAATPQLKVDGTDAKYVRRHGTTSVLGTSPYAWSAGEVVPFVYDGTQFQMLKHAEATTSYPGIVTLSSATNSTSTALAATASAVRLVRLEVGSLAAKVGAPTWNTAALGADPTVALAVAQNTAYRRTGTGTLTLSAVTGLTADPTYLVVSGFDSLVLPAAFAVAGSGAFRSGKENHLALWSTPTTNLVNFLFAQ